MSEWVEVCPMSDFTDRSKLFVHQNKRIALFRLKDGIYALDDTCSHAQYSLSEGEIINGQVECPGHGAMFDIRTGHHLNFPAVTHVNSYPVKIEDDRIFVKIENQKVDYIDSD